MTKKNLMPIIVLVAICILTAVLMGAVNMLTAPKIEANAEAAANKALEVVLPGASDFEKIELTKEYPAEVNLGYKADIGYVFRANVNGNASNLVVMCGVDNAGKITGVEVISDEETPSYKAKIFPIVTGSNGKYNGKDINNVAPEIASGATNSSQGIYKAVKAALNAYSVATGGEIIEKPDEEPGTTVDITTPVTKRTDEEIYNLAKGFYDGADVTFEDVFVYKPYVTTRKVFKNTADGTYVFYLATRTEYVELETEALILTHDKGKVLDINLLTWTVGHGVNYTPEYLNSFAGINKYSTDDVELVSNATSTSNNLVTALYHALHKVFGSVVITEEEIEARADKAAPLGDDAVRMTLPENAPKTVKAMFKLASGRGYVFYIVTASKYSEYETESFLYVDINGKIMDIDIVTWGHGENLDPTDEFMKDFFGETKETIFGGVEKISHATQTGDRVISAAYDALTLVPEHTNYSLIAAILLGVAVLSAVGVAVYVKVIKRRKENE